MGIRKKKAEGVAALSLCSLAVSPVGAAYFSFML